MRGHQRYMWIKETRFQPCESTLWTDERELRLDSILFKYLRAIVIRIILDSSPTRKRKIIVDFFSLSFLLVFSFPFPFRLLLGWEGFTPVGRAVGEVRVRACQDFDSKIPVQLTHTCFGRFLRASKLSLLTDVLTGGARSEGVSNVQD